MGGCKTCSYPELGKHKVKEKDCGKCEKNEEELTALKSTVESMKNALNTNSINMVNSENISEQSMKEKLVKDVLKTLRAEKSMMRILIRNWRL